MKEKCDEKTKTWLKIAFTNHDLDFKHHNENIVYILLDIILYKDPQIVNTGFTLLTNYYQQKSKIIYYAKLVQLLQDEQEVAIYRKVDETLRAMSDQATESDDWLGESGNAAMKLSMGFINKMEMLIELCTYVEDRVFETDNKKKSNESDEDDEEEEGEAKSDGDMNFDILQEDWDNEDNKIIDED